MKKGGLLKVVGAVKGHIKVLNRMMVPLAKV